MKGRSMKVDLLLNKVHDICLESQAFREVMLGSYSPEFIQHEFEYEHGDTGREDNLANFFEIPVEEIHRVYKNNSNEFKCEGAIKIKIAGINRLTRYHIVYPIRSVFLMAMFLKDNPVARSIVEYNLKPRDTTQKLFDTIIEYSYDYNRSELRNDLFRRVYNMLYSTITGGMVASEIIYTRCDSKKAYMGMSHWNPEGRTIAKNYLLESELEKLNRLSQLVIYSMQQHVSIKGKCKHMGIQYWLEFIVSIIIVLGVTPCTESRSVTKEQVKAKIDVEYKKYQERMNKGILK